MTILTKSHDPPSKPTAQVHPHNARRHLFRRVQRWRALHAANHQDRIKTKTLNPKIPKALNPNQVCGLLDFMMLVS